MKKRFLLLILGIVLLFFNVEFISAIPAFPGAEGFGAVATGGRGGQVIKVTNLNDNGPGSLREALTTPGPRIVVFDVSGYITLNSQIILYDEHSDLTIAGQTAPGDGITIRGNQIYFFGAENIIVRYLRFRSGNDWEEDAIGGNHFNNIIIDHVTASWGVDECLSFYGWYDYYKNLAPVVGDNLTIQYSIISEGLYWGGHSKNMRHSMGGIISGKHASIHHNLFAHNNDRNPLITPYDNNEYEYIENVDVRNNVIYNWGEWYAINAQENPDSKVNIVNNYFKAGPATVYPNWYLTIPFFSPNYPWYIEGNYIYGNSELTTDNWIDEGGGYGIDAPYGAPERASEPWYYAGVSTSSAEEAFDDVLENAGANYPKRDAIDARIVGEARAGNATYGGTYDVTGTDKSGIIDSPNDVEGYIPLYSSPAPLDSDNDGMPDYWEDEQGLDKYVDDSDLDSDGDGYTNIENYINGLVDNPIQSDCGNGIREGFEECDLGDENGECPSLCSDSCIANNCDGQCGSAIGDYYVGESFPSGNLCNNGDANPSNPSLVDTEGASVSWQCLGLAGGQDDSCSAQRIAIPECVDSSALSWQGFTFDEQLDTFTFVFNATPSADGIDSVFGLSAYEANEYNDLAAIVRFSQEGIIDVRNGSEYRTDRTINYGAGTQYNIRMEVDIPNKRYDVYIDDVLLARDYSFRTQQASVSNLSYWNIRVGNADHGYVEYCGAGVISEDPCNPYDLDCNGSVNMDDVDLLVTQWGQSYEDYDFNGDGTVNLLDLMMLIRNWG